MRTLLIGLLVVFTFSISCNDHEKDKKETPPSEDISLEVPSEIRVAVFEGYGASPGCITDAVEALKLDKDISAETISAAEIITGGLDNFDVLVIPGGGGSRQYSNMGDLGVQKIIDFVMNKGKGIVGICAGAYLLTNTPGYTCLKLSGAQAIDLEHDERGHGIAEFEMTEEGGEIFPELKDLNSCFVFYYEGPVIIPAENDTISYTSLATMKSDIHLQNNAPEGMTPGKPCFLNSKAGKGKVFLTSCHPETTPGMRWTVPRMARWTAGKELTGYSENVVRPDIYSEEILFDEELNNEESMMFNDLIYGSAREKIKAIERLVEIHSWSARYRIPGLLRDADQNVRLAAAKALVDIEYTSEIDDLEASLLIEKDENCKAELKKCLDALKNMIHINY